MMKEYLVKVSEALKPFSPEKDFRLCSLYSLCNKDYSNRTEEYVAKSVTSLALMEKTSEVFQVAFLVPLHELPIVITSGDEPLAALASIRLQGSDIPSMGIIS
jgi:hypothetical protein